jgi:hypothetical protein
MSGINYINVNCLFEIHFVVLPPENNPDGVHGKASYK